MYECALCAKAPSDKILITLIICKVSVFRGTTHTYLSLTKSLCDENEMNFFFRNHGNSNWNRFQVIQASVDFNFRCYDVMLDSLINLVWWDEFSKSKEIEFDTIPTSVERNNVSLSINRERQDIQIPWFMSISTFCKMNLRLKLSVEHE